MPKDILSDIIATKKLEVEAAKKKLPLSSLKAEIANTALLPQISMKSSLANSCSGIISEFKRKSPSKGWIYPDAVPSDIIPQYAKNGAAALSILTDKEYFGGDLEFIKQVRNIVNIPILRKDFIIDEYQIAEAKLYGANAILLIAAALERIQCMELLDTAHAYGLEVLLELHSTEEVNYFRPDVDMLGINNRHLGTFFTDVKQSFDLADKLKATAPETILVSESGISDPQIVKELRNAGYRGFLIGEHFMRHKDPGLALSEFIKEIER